MLNYPPRHLCRWSFVINDQYLTDPIRQHLQARVSSWCLRWPPPPLPKESEKPNERGNLYPLFKHTSFLKKWKDKIIKYYFLQHLVQSCTYHHHVVTLARISLTLSRHFSQSFIASGRSSGLHPVSSHSCWMYVHASRPDFARPYVGVHRSTSLMSSSLLLQQCPACLVRLTCIVFVMGGRWPYSWCLVGCCRQDLFNIARSILV